MGLLGLGLRILKFWGTVVSEGAIAERIWVQRAVLL